jgi:isopenicillin N synthase-like dioxygenase
MAVLSADIKKCVLALGDQCRGQEDQDIETRVRVYFFQFGQFDKIGSQPVHLPVFGGKFTGLMTVLLSDLRICYQFREQSERVVMSLSVPRIDAAALLAGDPATQNWVAEAATGVGFMTIYNTPVSTAQAQAVLATYHAFFALPAVEKAACDMAQTGSNRGWGAPGSERVDPDANSDYKQVYDCGVALAPDHPFAALPCYAPNIWPVQPADFRVVLQDYYRDATALALDLLCAVANAAGHDGAYFRSQFDQPMALLRGNYYPTRPAWAGEKDFGIATHTDYGCLTLLATDGSPGLEVRTRGGGWIPVSAPPGEFVINFGEMLEMWTSGQIKATPHRVVGTAHERISAPLFFNPNHDANIAPFGSDRVIEARTHLEARYAETYLHLNAS